MGAQSQLYFLGLPECGFLGLPNATILPETLQIKSPARPCSDPTAHRANIKEGRDPNRDPYWGQRV